MPVFKLIDEIVFPPVELAEPDGLLAVGGDLSTNRLLAAYREGIFPWFSEGDPLLWWFTSPRLVIFPDEFHIPKRLARTMRKLQPQLTLDSNFPAVIEQCAKIRNETGEPTWILPEMKDAYIQLHNLGFAHSVECWLNGELAGGLYGIALDRIFFGESMFSRKSGCSQFALIALIHHLKANNFLLVDCQMTTQHLLRFGAKEIEGESFSRYLQQGINTITPQLWKSTFMHPEQTQPKKTAAENTR